MTIRLFRASLLAVAATVLAAAQDPAAARPLEQQVDTLELREVPLREALRLLAEESGVNIVASEDAAAKKVTCFLQRITVRQAIETIAKTFGLWFREDETSGIVRVMTTKEYERDLVTFREERTQVFTLLFPNAVEVSVALRNLFGDRVQLSLDRDMLEDEYQEIQQRFQRFDVLDRRGQSLGILGTQSGVFDQSGLGVGLNSGLADSFRGQSFDRFNGRGAFGGRNDGFREQEQPRPEPERAPFSPEQLDRIERLLAQSVEGGSETLLEKLRGVQPSIYLTILRKSNMIAVRSADLEALREIERIVRTLDVPTPQVLLEVQILALDISDGFGSIFDSSASLGNHDIRFANGNIAAGTGLADPGSFVYQFVSDSFQARLQLLQSRDRVTALATPVLLVANNEVARLFVGEERPIVRNISSQTTVNQNVVTTTPTNTVETRPVGTTLLITPNINADRTVTLRILQENSDVLEGAASIPVVTSDGGVVNQSVDVVTSRSVSGTVVGKDGLTLALGGLVREGVEARVEGIPGLMDVPLLGVLFRREAKTRMRQELVVLVRPYVLFTPTESHELSRQLVDRISIHPSAPSMGMPLNVYQPGDAVRPPQGSDPLGELLRYQSGLGPTGQGR